MLEKTPHLPLHQFSRPRWRPSPAIPCPFKMLVLKKHLQRHGYGSIPTYHFFCLILIYVLGGWTSTNRHFDVVPEKKSMDGPNWPTHQNPQIGLSSSFSCPKSCLARLEAFASSSSANFSDVFTAYFSTAPCWRRLGRCFSRHKREWKNKMETCQNLLETEDEPPVDRMFFRRENGSTGQATTAA